MTLKDSLIWAQYDKQNICESVALNISSAPLHQTSVSMTPVLLIPQYSMSMSSAAFRPHSASRKEEDVTGWNSSPDDCLTGARKWPGEVGGRRRVEGGRSMSSDKTDHKPSRAPPSALSLLQSGRNRNERMEKFKVARASFLYPGNFFIYRILVPWIFFTILKVTITICHKVLSNCEGNDSG